MAFVGGLRTRLIVMSFQQMIRDSLDALGWFDAGRQHQPINFVVRPAEWEDKVDFNSIAVTCEDVADIDAETGSNLTEDTWTYSVDIYAEDDAVGIHLINDIRDILRGKIPSIGRTGPILPVFDYQAATPTQIFTCDIEDVVVDRARGFTKAWQQHWWAARCDVIDTYGDEDYA